MNFAGDVLELEDYDAVVGAFEANGWTDGLPVVPPTVERVKAMLEVADLDPGHEIGHFAEGGVTLDAEAVAVNAVMAGCLPEYMPVLIGIARGMTDPQLGLMNIQASTGGGAVMSIVGGPVAAEIGMNSGRNCLGPGNRANASIGRAVRLIQTNALSQRQGFYERSVFGRPDKYTFCFAESDELGSWPHLHEELGIPAGTSGVTLFGAQSGAHLADLTSPTAEEFLLGIARRMASLHISRFGLSSQVVVLSPDSHAQLENHGWTKAATREYLHEHALQSLKTLKEQAWCRTESVGGQSVRTPIAPGDEDRWFSITASPDAILLVVAGGWAARKAFIVPSITEYQVEAVPVAVQI